MPDLVIVGTGGCARQVHQVVEDAVAGGQPWTFIGFLDDNPARHGSALHDFPVLGGLDWLSCHINTRILVAIGNPSAKRAVVNRLTGSGFTRYASIVHPAAWVGSRNAIGPGTVVCAGSLVETDVRIGEHVLINLGCTIAHESVVEDYSTLAPRVNLAGKVRIAEGSDVGMGATVIQETRVGHWSIVGAGAVVIRDLPPNVTAVGVPAKVIKERPEGWHLSA